MMILTVELKNLNNQEVAIIFDEDGLGLLLENLNYLKTRIDHLHLMTEAWSGQELTEGKQGGDDYTLINHLRLVRIK